ncbi:hypothetical protein V6Z11_A09G276400 [Gossypium hirsutum]
MSKTRAKAETLAALACTATTPAASRRRATFVPPRQQPSYASTVSVRCQRTLYLQEGRTQRQIQTKMAEQQIEGNENCIWNLFSFFFFLFGYKAIVLNICKGYKKKRIGEREYKNNTKQRR